MKTCIIVYALCMVIFTATEARANLDKLIEKTLQSHEPVVIAGKK